MVVRDNDARTRAAYDAVARDYDAALRHELEGKPLDRALLDCFIELVGTGRVADVGCGPGHVTAFLAERHADVVGIDLSPQMVQVAREHWPHLIFEVATMLDLQSYAGQWAGAVALYSVIHFGVDERRRACAELGRALQPAGWLLVAFHVDAPGFAEGSTNQATSFFGHQVELDGHFLSPRSSRTTSRLLASPLWPGRSGYRCRKPSTRAGGAICSRSDGTGVSA